ncbi:protein involved in ribonucleotide reduction [Anaerotaenia torta]|uniref:class Ib ribonucleoside-diphosphate reductase assembly flavoprotein NrdI n=1 Tax=Anaerotaenia torta TaxID=433293 RepID=UPI003D1BB47C
MIIVYDSLTGLGKEFAEALGYPVQPVGQGVDEPCILVTRNVGLGKIPETTSRFLDQHRTYVLGVVVNGSKRFGPFYCKAADKINNLYEIPIIRKISGSGSREDIDFVKHFLKTLRIPDDRRKSGYVGTALN